MYFDKEVHIYFWNSSTHSDLDIGYGRWIGTRSALAENSSVRVLDDDEDDNDDSKYLNYD